MGVCDNVELAIIGIKTIDDAHEKILSVMRDICDIAQDPSSSRDAAPQVESLTNLFEEHLNDEEESFRSYGYTANQDLYLEHRDLLSQLKGLRRDLDNGVENPEFLAKFETFILKFVSHENTCDADFGNWLRENSLAEEL